MRKEGTMDRQTNTDGATFAPWQLKGIGVLRIIFGVVWGIDAWFKWQPSFVDNLTSYITGALDGQPAAVGAYIHFWHHIVGVDPRIFAYLVAIAETVVALGLIFGVFSNLIDVSGALLCTVIWSTAEGLGGPYKAGSTDIGAAIIYVLVFAGLVFARAGLQWGLDRRLTLTLGKWGFLASGPFTNPFRSREKSENRPQAGPVAVQ
jgi:uncharacterized membrane protein YphA (DoxX/SURF4 family)